MKAEQNELTELLSRAEGSILTVGVDWPIENTSIVEAESLESAGTGHAAVVIGALRSMSPLAAARAAAQCVKPGGTVAFAVPTTRPGLKGQAGSLFGMIRRKKPVLLEELCEALLHAGLTGIEARELDTGAGLSIVWARAPQYST